MLNLRNDRQVSMLFGVVFLLVAVLGFVPNPLVSPTGIFAVNAMHNVAHALLGVVLLVGANMGRGKQALMVVGVVYLALAVIGYVMMTDMLLGMVMVNMNDHYLHLLLGVVLLFASSYVRPSNA